jgi:hypothetical protein
VNLNARKTALKTVRWKLAVKKTEELFLGEKVELKWIIEKCS